MALADALTLGIRIGAVLALVLLNGFFVAAEFAIVKVRDTQLEARVRKGDRRARGAKHVVEHLDAYLSATQLGITLASLGLGWIGEPVVAAMLEPAFHSLGVSDALLHPLAFAVAFSIITFLHIVVGELAPKSLAIQRAEHVTLWTAAPLRIFYRVFSPFIWILNKLANLLLRAIGLPPASEAEVRESEEELRLLLAEAGRRRTLPAKRADVLQRVFQLKDLQARNVMTPRTRTVALDLRKPLEENLAIAEETEYSRFPVVEGNLENVQGMVHYRDLVRLSRAERPQKGLASITRPVLFVPESQPVETLLGTLISRGIHMAIVSDEHGSTAGIVTMEDVFEELFGEIRDEFDTAETTPGFRDLGEDHFVLDGLMPLHRAGEVLGVDLHDPEVTTLSGYVVSQLGRLPAKGERVRIGPFEGIVREVQKRRVGSIELWRERTED